MDEKIFLEAKKLQALSVNESEKVIAENALNIVKNLHLDDECLLACILYFPYIKTSIYTSPSEKEYKNFDEIRKKQEDERKKKILSERQTFKDNIVKNYGNGVLSFLHSLKKLLEVDYQNQEEAENIRKMFFALVKDVRVIMVKLCFILAEIKYKKSTANNDIKLKANQIFELYAPLAARLGLSSIKTELEDIAFSTLYPDEYKNIIGMVELKFKERENAINNLKEQIKSTMKELGLSGELMGRKKHTYSIYKKFKEKGGNLEKIYDLIAVRAILPTIADCYVLLGKIHEIFTPLQNRFKDYIAIPKSNGYQSLHTTILFENIPVEVQIRTQEMHRSAEFGVAAHWIYKEKRTKTDSLDEKLGWIREIMENEQSMTSEDLINSLKVDIYDGEIFVQTPKGKVLHMPEDSTPIDFAYMIHSDVGNKCVGAKVNGKMQPITKPLANGDIVEIITSSSSKGPSRDWVKIVKTSQAKNKILSFFKKEMKEENIKEGKLIFEQAIKNAGYSVAKLTDKKYLQSLLEKYNFSLIDELLSAIGYGAYSAKVISGKLINIYETEMKKQREKIQVSKIEKTEVCDINTEDKIKIQGVNNLMVKFAKCCCPIEGDDIIGFISQGRGIIIHRKRCPNLSFFDSERLIEVEWKSSNKNVN
ncbi:MAG: RelA/SpoT family protein [Clostridia bacterium]|nr:RelA/SpoT family protein [Clostridia bacterium]